MSKKIKSTWIYDDVKVEFSEPSIQAGESVVHAETAKDILYYYYTMTVYRRNDKKKWKKEFISYACDFQALLCVNGMAEELLKDDFDGGTWQKTQIPDSDGIIWYKKSIDTAGIINEDIYRLARTVRIDEDEKLDWFTVDVGSGNDPRFAPYTGGAAFVSFDMLKREDFMAFVNTVKDFIDKSIKAFNQEQDKNIQLEAGARVVKNGKLYEYKDRIEGIARCNKLESVYIPGDSLDFKIKTKKDDKDIFVDFHNCRLVSVEDGFITVTDGYKTVNQKPESLEGQQVRIPVETIMYSNAIEPSTKLRFSKKQCMDDFYAIMSDEEKAEFAETPIDALVEKWFGAVVDRTWIFRDEHGFRNPRKTTKKIIKKIKKKCQAEKSAKEIPEE
ncbi:hypothetical protein DW884_10270 [Ruminococcus sp. AM40-10AC]|nr:hypothetical protein DW884_10270 [Ruminococcus sp. AM40-10AC]